MASDQVRQASKVLGPLLRRRGTSPDVGATLRRALQALDKSLTGLSPQAQDATIEDGVAALRACVDLCERSERPADHDQLDGLKKALALLAPTELAVVLVPPPDLGSTPAGDDKSRPSSGTPGASRAPRRGKRRPTKRPALDLQTAGLLLDGYEAKLRTLHVVLTEPLFRLADLHGATAELQRQVTAIKWQGRERIPEFLRVADVAKNAGDRLAAGAALVHLGEARGAEMLMGILAKAATDEETLPEPVATLLRTLNDASLLDWFLRIFLQPTHSSVRGLLLPLLAERNQLSSERLWELANHAKDDIAVEAALALPWADGNPDLPLLLSWARQARTPRRAHALLLAATVLGSGAALAEVRARAGDDQGADRLLVDALAVAGAPADASALLSLVARADEDTDYILLAAANLGGAELLASLPSVADRVPDSTLDEARRMLIGEIVQGDGGAKPDPSVRMLRGRPWSVSGLIDCLGDPGETLQSQRWMSLELRARTGQVPLSSLPALMPAEARSELLANWKSYYAKADGRLRPGGWYYQGKVVEGA